MRPLTGEVNKAKLLFDKPTHMMVGDTLNDRPTRPHPQSKIRGDATDNEGTYTLP